MRFQSLTAWLQRAGTFVVVFLLVPGAAPVAGSQPIEAQIDSYLTDRIKANGIPGLALAVVRDGRVIFSRAYGVSEVGSDEKITPEHIFHFASVSKPFVATAIAQLVERGELELDDPVVKHLPYFRLADERYQDITIQRLND